jgi:hypothetical protein
LTEAKTGDTIWVVGKRTKQDLEDEQALVDAGHPVPARRLERWRGLGLGPLTEDPASRIEHYELLDQLLGSGRSSSWAALVMAGYGFPTQACRDPLVRFYEPFNVDEPSSPLPSFGGADYEDVSELSGRAITERLVITDDDEDPGGTKRAMVVREGRIITDEDEALDDAERVLRPFAQRILGNLPLGDASLILDDAVARMTGFRSADPNLAPEPERALALMPSDLRTPEVEASLAVAESMLLHTSPISPELARVAREEPLESLAQAAKFACEFVQGLGWATGDEEKDRALGAFLAPGFLAVMNVLQPTVAGLLRKRGLDSALPSVAEDSPT